MTETESGREADILIVGAGASGALLALHLLRHSAGRLGVVLVERGPEVARGVAYGAQAGRHLLNTRPGDMSAWPDEPGHFAAWLASEGVAGRAGFFPRESFGRYLAGLLDHAIQASTGSRLIQGDVADIVEGVGGMTARLADGRSLSAHRIVLATGHRPQSRESGPIFGDPWSAAALAGLAPDADVALLGTGLTMIDMVGALRDRGHRGRILALSRRGLLPRVHPETAPAAAHHDLPEAFAMGELSQRLAAFRRLVRAGESWSVLMHTLRPHNGALWEALDETRQRRFLRHLRPWWDVHRHRVPPDAWQLVDEAMGQGRLSVVRGRIAGLDAGAAHVALRFSRHGSSSVEAARFDRVIDCRGPRHDIAADDGLLKRLTAKGWIRPDALGLALDVDGDGHVVAADGERSHGLLAFGPPTRGRHWEITAVPDIRKKAQAMAAQLVQELAG